MADIAQLAVQMLTQGVVYALLAMGLAVVYRTSKVLNFAHGELLVVGVFVFFTLNTNPLLPLPYPVAAIVAIVLTAALGCVEYLVAVRSAAWLTAVVIVAIAGALIATRFGAWVWLPTIVVAVGAGFALRRVNIAGLQGSIGWVLGTIAFAAVLQEGLVALIGATGEDQRIPGMFSSLSTARIGDVVIPFEYVATAAVGLVLVVAFDLLESRTRFGRAMKAVAANSDAAALVGIDVRRVVYAAYALAAASAVIAGLLITPLTFAKPTSGPTFTIIALTAALVGGIDRVRAAALGGLVLGVVEIGLGRVLAVAGNAAGAANLTALRNVIVLALLIGVLVVRPRGLFGTPDAERVG